MSVERERAHTQRDHTYWGRLQSRARFSQLQARYRPATGAGAGDIAVGVSAYAQCGATLLCK